jgi:hypothetical protein
MTLQKLIWFPGLKNTTWDAKRYYNRKAQPDRREASNAMARQESFYETRWSRTLTYPALPILEQSGSIVLSTIATARLDPVRTPFQITEEPIPLTK